MDLALSRLRINGAEPGSGCSALQNSPKVCADQELFERLVSELAVSMAPPTSGPARSSGPRSFQLSFNTTITSIEGGRSYWAYGTEGDGSGKDGSAFNSSPQSVMVWNRAEARKGLPFGFEVGAALGQGLNTSLWSYGLALKWSLVEGFHSGLGRLPDVSLQTAIDRSVGSSQASVQVVSFDVTLSKPFVIERISTISPFTGLQMLWNHVESGLIDLTPGGPTNASTGEPDPDRDAYNACKPLPGNTQGALPLQCSQGGDPSDFSNDVAFKTLDQTRVRMFLGAQARYEMFLLSMSMLFDLFAPNLDAERRHLHSGQVARQLAFSLAVGAVL
jgi:hypothetical protein